MKTLKVTGKGTLRLAPDTTRITLSLEGTFPDYDAMLERSAQSSEQLRALLQGLDFAPSALKTLAFNVNTEYESVHENGVYRQRFVGYHFCHTMKLEFPSDNKRLGRVLFALANCPAKPEFQLSYTVGDPEAAKNALLARAVADAREKAQVLAKAADAGLGSLQSMDYSWGEIDLEVRPMNRMMLAGGSAKASAEADAFALDLEPDDIVVSDTVTLVWEIL